MKNDGQTNLASASWKSCEDVLLWRLITPLYREFTTTTGKSKFQYIGKEDCFRTVMLSQSIEAVKMILDKHPQTTGY